MNPGVTPRDGWLRATLREDRQHEGPPAAGAPGLGPVTVTQTRTLTAPGADATASSAGAQLWQALHRLTLSWYVA
jgi:hypothetical protein